MIWILFLILLLQPTGEAQNLQVGVVEGTLHAHYQCMVTESDCGADESIEAVAHISWITEKEKTTHLSVVMQGAPYTDSELTDMIGNHTIFVFSSSQGVMQWESENISSFWEWWFAAVEPYGFFSEFSETVMYHWNEVEITYREDSSGKHYSLTATYYDYFTKFYPTPEDFFNEKHVDFQLIFGIDPICPTVPTEIILILDQSASEVKVTPSPHLQEASTVIWECPAGESILPMKVKFSMGRYLGTALPQLKSQKTLSTTTVSTGEPVTITLTISNITHTAAYNVQVTDEIPESFVLSDGETTTCVEQLEGDQSLVITYTVIPSSPGTFMLSDPFISFEDQFGKEYEYQEVSGTILLSVCTEAPASGLLMLGGLLLALMMRK